MPLFIFFPYVLVEALAFYGLARLIGVGWALVVLVGCFIGGLVLAAQQMRSLALRAAEGRESAGRFAGDSALVAAGSVGVALPGIVTTVIGLLLIIPPTRAVVRRIMARRLRRFVEDLGAKSFAMTSQYSQGTRYGSFVVDEQPVDPQQGRSIQKWVQDVSPDDFHKRQ